ncbi:DUF2892 domain-containing protein [Lysinibacillus sp. SGAir0095]|uniref:YgaP family membrane protein n=1 Tax=Lysinibacillus sp. SGAir0095 TaxID=2070463 RepID=UPI0010CCF1DD|nr:DUF2892 domain-containing protein [Lysinibacillus sp. SGAir0095]QCR33879.1 hypothetical protein C1N55_17815 [Lysinibacillus sp. SGAir0095]
MEENISDRSGFVRLALGTGLTACGIAHLAKESGNRGLGALFVAAGAMKVAEGIFLYCPMKALINSNVKEAVATTFNEYLDGDSIMNAYNDFYTEKWGSGYSGSGTSQTANSGVHASTNVEKAASDIGQIVSNATQNDALKDVASQAVKSAASSGSGK